MGFRDISDNAKLENLIRASDNGEEWAQREYGQIFDEYDMDPDFIERVCKARVNIYKDAAKQGNKNAILRYAHALAHLGYKKEAYDWYLSLINKGDTDAMLALSEQYNKYGSFGHNPDEEIRWLKRAADGGNSEAQCNMGLECLCVKDKYNALRWYELSAKQNNAKGKIGYAKCLHDQLEELDCYSKGWKEIVPGQYECIKKIYGTLSPQECRAVMNDLYYKIENLYLDGLNNCRSDSYLSDAFYGLSRIYLYTYGVCEPLYYFAAFYAYENYRTLDNDYAYDKCMKIINENKLNVTQSDLKEWGKIGIFDWAEKHGIDICEKNNQKTKSATTAKEDNNSCNNTSAFSSTALEKSVINYIVEQFNIENNIDLSTDNIALTRIENVVRQNIDRIQNNASVLIKLPFISSNAQGPLHLIISVSLDKLSNIKNDCCNNFDSHKRTTAFLQLTVRNTLNPLGLANGSKYRFIIDGTKEIVLIAKNYDVSRKEEIPCGKHTVSLEVYGYNDSIVQKKPIYTVKQHSFTSYNGKTTFVTTDRGGMFVSPKIMIKNS